MFISDYQCAPGKLGPFVNKCYWTTSDLLSWANSATVCNDGGSILASFSDNSTYFTVIDGLGILNGYDIQNEFMYYSVYDLDRLI